MDKGGPRRSFPAVTLSRRTLQKARVMPTSIRGEKHPEVTSHAQEANGRRRGRSSTSETKNRAERGFGTCLGPPNR
jgi:hypothetical protein